MYKLILRLFVVAVMALAVMPVSLRSTQAQASTAQFTTTVIIANPNGAAANYVVNFYPQLNGTAVAFAPSGALAANGSTEILVGGLTSGFVGSGVISADQNVVAVMAQIPTGNYNRMIASAFGGGDGSSKLNLASFLVNVFNRMSTFAVQNVESVPVKIRARFIDTTGTQIAAPEVTIPANASKIFEAKTTSTIAAGFPATFNGSVVVTATIGTTAADAKVVGIAQEVSNGGPNPNAAYAFEAIPQAAAASVVYMPTALCKLGGNAVTTNFAVQNVGSSATTFSVTYKPTSGSPVVVNKASLNAGQKTSFNPCADAAGGGVDAVFNGSAVIDTTGGTSQPMIIIGKAQSTLAGGFVTAYIGQPAGVAKLSFPYVRFGTAASSLQTFLSAQNIGGGTIASMTFKFYNGANGNLVSTCTFTSVAVGAKTSTNANDTSGPCSAPTNNFVGSVVVEAPGGSLIGIARNTLFNAGFSASEDHNAIFLP